MKKQVSENFINYLIIFVHGSYAAGELKYEDFKFHLLKKLLERTSGEEIALANAIGDQMACTWPWPPQKYDDRFAHRISENPYVWSRNLMANRLYNGPVVFVEGPFMDNKEIYARLIEGDYEGEKTIKGKLYRSIFREYAEIIAQGIINRYSLRP